MGDACNNLQEFTGVWIEIEKCIDCASHEYCTRHVEQKYQSYELNIQSIMEKRVPSAATWKFVSNPGPKSHGVNCIYYRNLFFLTIDSNSRSIYSIKKSFSQPLLIEK